MKEKITQHFGDGYGGAFKRYLPESKSIGGNGEYLSICPFHDDHNPSLSFNAKSGQWICHGCGAKGDFIEFYRLKHGMNGNFPAVLNAIAQDFGIETEGKPKRGAIVRTHDYTDAAGDLTAQKIKYGSGNYAWRRLNQNKEWIYNRKGVALTLYNLHAIAKANEIWFSEGEKDADNLSELGLTATTLPDGAGSKIKLEVLGPLNGKHIVICADNDEPGRKHAEEKAKALHGIAASIKILHFPELPEKGDVSDFIASCQDAEGAAERLAIMADNAPEYEPSEAFILPFRFVHIKDLLDNQKPIEWRIRGVMPDNSLFYSFGDPGTYKTFGEIDRCLSIAAGIDYHSHPTKQGTVFLIAGEGQRGLSRRIAAFCIAHRITYKELPFFVSETPTQLMDKAALDDVRHTVDSMANEYGLPALVLIDTLARNFGNGDENATKDMNTVIANLDAAFGNDFCRGLIHHTGHGNKERARGSIALHGAADIAFRYSLKDDERILIECTKMKDAPLAPAMLFSRREILLKIGDVEDQSYVLDLESEGDDATGKTDKAVIAKRVISLLDEGQKYADIAGEVNVSTASITRIKKQAIKDGWLTKKNRLTQQGVLYVYEG